MIESKYNYYTSDGDKIICLNGISQMTFAVKKETFEFIKEILADEKKQADDPAITEQLSKMHFLVDNQEQDTELLLNKMKADYDSPFYYLIINPTQDCIFKCWYCYETHKKSKMSEETLANIKKFVSKTIEREDIDRFLLGWFGGEPLMYFDEIVYPLSLYIKQKTELKNKTFTCNMTTNGFLLTKEIIAKCYEVSLKTLQVTLDGDEESHNRTRNKNGEPSFRKIMDNCIDYCSYSSENRLVLRINYTDKIIKTQFSEILEKIPIEVRQQINVQFKRVWQTYEKKTQKTPEGLLDNQENLQKMNFKQDYTGDFEFMDGCKCYADRNNYANINFDGRVYKCTAVNYDKNNALGYLSDNGDIVWENNNMGKLRLKLPIEDTKCLRCNLLPICGGPCFLRKQNTISEGVDICCNNSLDTDVDTFIKNYYNYIQKKK